MEPSERWQVWLREAPPAAQVALDGALTGHQERPDYPGFFWARCALGEGGVPPVLHWPDRLEPGVSWEDLALSRGDAYAVPTRRWVDALKMAFVWVPGGTFTMGWLQSSLPGQPRMWGEASSRRVRISSGFWLGMYPVTNSQFSPMARASNLTMSIYSGNPRFNRPNLPVVGVLLNVAHAYCRWAREQSGLQVRLPWESEWEWAARGPDPESGPPRVYPWGFEPPTPERAVFDQGGKGSTVEGDRVLGVSYFGARDMVGQVWEWCNDQFKTPFFDRDAPLEVTNPRVKIAPPTRFPAGYSVRGSS